jgi:hypothetical protein
MSVPPLTLSPSKPAVPAQKEIFQPVIIRTFEKNSRGSYNMSETTLGGNPNEKKSTHPIDDTCGCFSFSLFQ